MLVTEFIEIKWSRRNKEWFENKGYIFTNYADKILVKTLDLTCGSHAQVTIQCDYCKKKLQLKAKDFFKQRNKTEFVEDVCNNCGHLKSRKNNKLKYGIENPMHMESTKENLKQTMLDKYGVENISLLPETHEQKRETYIANYGVDHIFKTQEFKNNMKKLNLERYGVEYSLQAEEVRAKGFKTIHKKGNGACSAQQYQIHSLIEGELNYPVNTILLDIAFPDEMIYVEYDGGGHDLCVKLGRITQDEFNKKEKRRSFYLLDQGWKEIRIKSEKDKLPSDESILNFVAKAKTLINAKYSRFISWDMDLNKVVISNKKEYNLQQFLELEVE